MWQYSFPVLALAALVSGSPASYHGMGAEPRAFALSVGASSTPASQAPQQILVDRAADGLFYVDAKAGTASVRMVVDTGATHVVLSHADAKRAGVVVASGTPDMIATAAGHIGVNWVILERVELQGRVLRRVKAAVPHQDTGVSLLGQNVLGQFEGLRIDGDTLSLIG
jgi:aspartyl protease family protein